MADMFKKYEAMMAQKGQRNAEKQVKQRQRRTFATKINNVAIESLDEIKDLNSTLCGRFISKLCRVWF